MNNKLFLGSVLAGFLLLPAALHGQGNATATVQTPQVRIDAVLAEAARLQLPVSGLKNKVAEGRAKNITPEKIAAVVEARLKSLSRASEVLTRMNVTVRNAGEVALLADALEAGIRENLAVETLRSIPVDRREVAMSTLTSMVRSGVVSQVQLADLQKTFFETVLTPEKISEIIASSAAARKRYEDYKKLVEEILKNPNIKVESIPAHLIPAIPLQGPIGIGGGTSPPLTPPPVP
jgi:hypothetical protein